MTRLRQDDRGQITTALVMVGIVLLVALGLLVTKLGQATDQKSKVQTAADAAALAGAQQIRKEVPQLVLTAIHDGAANPFVLNPCGMGEAQARDFAGRAGAAVTEYCYFPGTDTVQVKVESSSLSVSGSKAMAKAEARVGRTLGDCGVLPAATAATASPTPTATLPTPPNGKVSVTCGALSLDVVLDSTGVITEPSISDVFGMFEPALKS
jgi:uncharacterized membrane protein